LSLHFWFFIKVKLEVYRVSTVVIRYAHHGPIHKITNHIKRSRHNSPVFCNGSAMIIYTPYLYYTSAEAIVRDKRSLSSWLLGSWFFFFLFFPFICVSVVSLLRVCNLDKKEKQGKCCCCCFVWWCVSCAWPVFFAGANILYHRPPTRQKKKMLLLSVCLSILL
jgi:hypothetical protein